VAGIIKRNPKAFAMAVAMHLALLFFLVFGLDWLERPKAGGPKVDVVEAKVIDEHQIKAEAEKLKKEKQQVKAKQLEEKTKAQKDLERLKREQVRLKKKQKAEQDRLAKLKKQRELEAKKQAQAAEERKKREAAEAERRRKAQQEAERKRKAEEARKSAEEEARRLREDNLRKSLEAEQNAREINQFAIAVGDKVNSNWLRPPGTSAGLRCKLQVRLAPNGTVLGVQVVQSSGNPAFDRSAESAVFKSDPLPAPPLGMREITFVFDPDKSG
jgi:colicin import membrane protein